METASNEDSEKITKSKVLEIVENTPPLFFLNAFARLVIIHRDCESAKEALRIASGLGLNRKQIDGGVNRDKYCKTML